MPSCPYLAVMCNEVSPLVLACHDNEGHISRISSIKLAVDSDPALRVVVDSDLVAMCNGVSLLALTCRKNEGQIVRIFFTKLVVVDSIPSLIIGRIVDSDPTLGVVESDPDLMAMI
jgi:hypothetical protein